MRLDVLDNCLARQTADISFNLDVVSQPAWPHRRGGRNLIKSKGPCSLLRSLLFSSSATPSLFLLQIPAHNHSETMRGPTIHGSIIGSSTSTLPLLNQKREAIKGGGRVRAGRACLPSSRSLQLRWRQWGERPNLSFHPPLLLFFLVSWRPPSLRLP